MLKCQECQNIIPDDHDHRRLEDDLAIFHCPICKLTFTIAIDLSTAEVTHEIEDAFTDIYIW